MKIITGIASTTHVDAHYERMAKVALDRMVEQIKERFIPQLFDHDPNQQIGVLLCGKVEQLEDGEFALFIVSGIFESEEEKQKYPVGSPNTVWQEYLPHLDGILEETAEQRANIKKNMPDPKEPPQNIAELLEIHLDSTAIWTDGRVYKIKHLIDSTGDLSIHVYPKDHRPAHCHVKSKQRGIDARFDIETLEVIDADQGLIRERDIKKIQDFFQTNPAILKKMRDEHARMQ
jgi:hypothetical protein